MPRPSLRRRVAILGPTPGSESSPSSRRSGRPPAAQGEATRQAASAAGEGPHGPTDTFLPQSASSNQKKPTAPGPAWVPTTAPSIVSTSISACGRTRAASSRSA